MSARIAEGRAAIPPDTLLDACLYEMGALELQDACLYEMGALELQEPTTRIILEELGIHAEVPTADTEEFKKVTSQVLRLVTSSREYQFA